MIHINKFSPDFIDNEFSMISSRDRSGTCDRNIPMLSLREIRTGYSDRHRCQSSIFALRIGQAVFASSKSYGECSIIFPRILQIIFSIQKR